MCETPSQILVKVIHPLMISGPPLSIIFWVEEPVSSPNHWLIITSPPVTQHHHIHNTTLLLSAHILSSSACGYSRLLMPSNDILQHEMNEWALLFAFSGSVLDNASNTYTGGRHASLIASLSKANGSSSGLGEAATLQLREGSLAGQKVNYLDSGYSEEDTDQQITSCLMQTASGSIYIPGSKSKFRLHLLPAKLWHTYMNGSLQRPNWCVWLGQYNPIQMNNQFKLKRPSRTFLRIWLIHIFERGSIFHGRLKSCRTFFSTQFPRRNLAVQFTLAHN